MKAKFLLALLGISVLAAGCGNRNNLAGKWSETETAASGAIQTTTCQFMPDGLATVEAKTSKGSLVKIHGGDLSSALGAAMFPTVARINTKETYTVKDDVLTLKVVDVKMYNPQNQPASLPNLTHASQEILKFKIDGDKLTVDKLDGTPPIVYTRQRS